MSKEAKNQIKETVEVLRSISGSGVPYAEMAGRIIGEIENPEAAQSHSAAITLPASVRKLIEDGVLPEVVAFNTQDLLALMDQMALAVIQVSTEGSDYIEDQQFLDDIASLRVRYQGYSDDQLIEESRFVGAEQNPSKRRAKVYILSDLLNDRGLPVPEDWTNNYLQ